MDVRILTIPAVDRPGGNDAAPAALEHAGLSAQLAQRGIHATTVPVAPVAPDALGDDDVTNIAYLGANIAAAVADALRSHIPALIIGSNCNALVGVLAGFEQAYSPTARIGLVWFDAHGDFNTPSTTLTGRIGGMPVAVCAGLAYAHWREITGLVVPVPTNRIIMVDVRNLDPKEKMLIAATDVIVASVERGRPGVPLADALVRLVEVCDVLYLHVDEDVLDAPYVPNHGTIEPNGPDMAAVLRALQAVFATGKVAAFGLVSVNAAGEGGATSIASAMELLTNGVEYWRAAGNVA